MRLNTNGHGNAINGRDITAELKEAADIVSVSLNESNSRRIISVFVSATSEKRALTKCWILRQNARRRI